MSEYHRIASLEKIIEEQKLAISQISHEIRNPVTLINSSLQLIEQEHPEVTTFAFWKETQTDMRYLIELLDALSQYNNGESFLTETINTYVWLMELVSSMKITSTESRRFTHAISPALLPINGNPVKLFQALTNLLRNGFEALTGTGEVSLKAFMKEHKLHIHVGDTGCGIPPEYLDTMFDPFVTHKAEGSGLGLAITKRIIEAHNGTLGVHSVLHQGTVFKIILPVINH